MRKLLQRLRLGSGKAAENPVSRPRLVFEKLPSVTYAIGDVHGCYRELSALEEKIAADAAQIEGTKWIVMLGDYVDRGPDSARVLDHLLKPPLEGFKRYCLAGNHEEVMLSFLNAPAKHRQWLEFGGIETLRSYGFPDDLLAQPIRIDHKFRQKLESHLPDEHIDFLRSLPILLETPEVLFVHAGLRPGVPVADQNDLDLIWIRDEFLFDNQIFDQTIVHGHTPVAVPTHKSGRVNVDTGAFATGRLTAARISADGEISFLSNRD